MTPEEQAVLDASRLYFNDGTSANRAVWKRATKAYIRSIHLLEDQKNEAINRLLLGIRRVA